MAIQCGPHTFEVDEDIIITRLRGSFSLEHMKEWCRIADQVIAKHGGVFGLSDFTAGGTIDPQSRRYVSEWPNVAKVRGVILFGASYPLQVIMSMIIRAAALVKRTKIPLISVKTEAAARTWVSEQRSRPSVGADPA